MSIAISRRGEQIMRKALIVAGVALALAGCGPQPQSASEGGAPTRIFDAQRNALDKSKTVNETIMQGDQALRAQEEAQAK
jgi:hypothetical protein